MKKSCFLLLLTILCSSISFAQSLKSISILGDSYSTFEGYLQPDTNSIWYYVSPRQQTDVTSVKQTWWHKFIKENNYRLCVNNSFSGATICNTGYRNEDYSDRSFITRMDQLGCPNQWSVHRGFGYTKRYHHTYRWDLRRDKHCWESAIRCSKGRCILSPKYLQVGFLLLYVPLKTCLP